VLKENLSFLFMVYLMVLSVGEVISTGMVA
jgi:hypothetical protein